jgi:hypothetical protein
MHKLSPVICAIGLGLLTACGTSSGPGPDGVTRGPAPYAALTSSSEALKVAFDQVCMPVVLDGGDFVALAKSRYMVEVKPGKDSTGQASQTFRLASFGEVTATLWADGSCMVALERGDSEELSSQALASLSSRGHAMTRGTSGPAPNDGVRIAFCNPDPRPLILAVTTPASKSSKRLALVATLYRAKGGASDICLRPTRS